MVVEMGAEQSTEFVTGPELRELRHRVNLSLRDVREAWPRRPVKRQTVAPVERLAPVTASQARNYFAAVREAAQRRAIL
jgi:hypothetical protein